jgi:hypothetical protein
LAHFRKFFSGKRKEGIEGAEEWSGFLLSEDLQAGLLVLLKEFKGT